MNQETNEVGLQLGTKRGQSILIVGESPAKNGWIVSKRAFYTTEGNLLQTGKRLNVYLEPFELTVEEISFTELVKCYVQDRKDLEKLAPRYFGQLLNQIEELRPKIVITLGVIPNKIFETQLSSRFPIGDIYSTRNFEYFPIYHPSPASPYGHTKNLELFSKHLHTLEGLIN